MRKGRPRCTGRPGSSARRWSTSLPPPAPTRAPPRYNVTPLSLAAAAGNDVIIERLLKAGADPNGTSEEGQTALMTASLTGKVDAVKLLLETGADANAREPYKGQ